ncbi:hypothetical protein BKA69DRAFT_293040 [Paraphysoderma sedebokerense]|nr:hypothetical protein BKA69DRAFT_293040 [Paraphysoderma sedebokerense]
MEIGLHHSPLPAYNDTFIHTQHYINHECNPPHLIKSERYIDKNRPIVGKGTLVYESHRVSDDPAICDKPSEFAPTSNVTFSYCSHQYRPPSPPKSSSHSFHSSSCAHSELSYHHGSVTTHQDIKEVGDNESVIEYNEEDVKIAAEALQCLKYLSSGQSCGGTSDVELDDSVSMQSKGSSSGEISQDQQNLSVTTLPSIPTSQSISDSPTKKSNIPQQHLLRRCHSLPVFRIPGDSRTHYRKPFSHSSETHNQPLTSAHSYLDHHQHQLHQPSSEQHQTAGHSSHLNASADGNIKSSFDGCHTSDHGVEVGRSCLSINDLLDSHSSPGYLESENPSSDCESVYSRELSQSSSQQHSRSPSPQKEFFHSYDCFSTQTSVKLEQSSFSVIVESGHPLRRKREKKTHVCHLCNKVFTRAFNLKSHLKTHTQEKPFPCSFCDRSFARKHDCERHIKIHTQDRCYKCKCGKSYTRSDGLTRYCFLL